MASPRLILVDGWATHLKTNSSNWIISPSKGENKTYLKPPPSILLVIRCGVLVGVSHTLGIQPYSQMMIGMSNHQNETHSF